LTTVNGYDLIVVVFQNWRPNWVKWN